MPSFTNLPGIIFGVRDGGIVPVQTTPTTDSILIIGCAVDGPVGVIRSIQNPSDIEREFGPLIYDRNNLSPKSKKINGAYTDPLSGQYNGNSIARSAVEAINAGAGDIRVVRVGGISATKAVTGASVASGYNISFPLGYSSGTVVNSPSFTSGSTSGSWTTFGAIARNAGRLYNNVRAKFGFQYELSGTVLSSVASGLPAGTLAFSSGATYRVVVEGKVNGHPYRSFEKSTTEVASGSLQVVFYPPEKGDYTIHLASGTGSGSASYESATLGGKTVVRVTTSSGAVQVNFGSGDATNATTSGNVFYGAVTGSNASIVSQVNGSSATALPQTSWGWNVTQPKKKGGDQFIPVKTNGAQTIGDALKILNNSNLNKSIIVTCSDLNILNQQISVDDTGYDVKLYGEIVIDGGWNGTTADGELYADYSVNAQTGTASASTGLDANGLTSGWPGTAASGISNFGKYGLYQQIQALYPLIADYEVDFIVLSALYADDEIADTDSNYSGDDKATVSLLTGDTDDNGGIRNKGLGQFLHELSRETYPTIGIVGTRPQVLPTKTSIDDFASSLGWVSTSDPSTCEAGWRYNVNQEDRVLRLSYFLKNQLSNQLDEVTGEEIDYGSYLSLFVQDNVFFENTIGSYVENGVSAFAGLLCNQKPQRGVTNLAIPGTKGLAWQFSKPQLEQLSAGVGRNALEEFRGGGSPVCMRFLPNHGNLIVEDFTLSHKGSDYENLSIRRIVNTALSLIKDVSFPYIGGENSAASQMALKTQIKTVLESLYEAGALIGSDGRGYDFAILVDPFEAFIGDLRVVLTLIPALQIRQIRVVARVTR
jgi:hypothetical protein